MHLPRFVAHNLGWKAISVLAAILVWMSLKSTTPARFAPTASRTFRRLPITVMTAATDQHIFRVEPSLVDVRVSGNPEQIDKLQPSDIHVFVDLTTVTQARDLRLRVEVYTPAGLRLVAMSPKEVLVQVLPAPSTMLPSPKT